MKCTFIGHSDAPFYLREKIKLEVEELITSGVRDFLVGNNGRFDYMVQSVLSEKIKENYDINLTVVLSYIDESAIYVEQKYTIYPEGLEKTPLRYAISKRNDWLIQRSNIMVAYVKHNFSNSHKWLEKAKKKGLKIINLADT